MLKGCMDGGQSGFETPVMKLAFCLFKYFPYSGLARDLLRVAQECHSRGHEPHIFVSEWQGERPQGFPVNVLSVLPMANHRRNAAFHNQFKHQVQDRGFDAIVGFNKMPGLDIYYVADSCYIARAVSRHGLPYRLTPRYRSFCAYERAVFGVYSTTTILMLSDREKSVYQQYYGTPDSRFRLLPPTLDINRRLAEHPEVVRRKKRLELGVDDAGKLVLFIGSGFKTKGLDRAIKAIASLPEPIRQRTRLMVVGQDSRHSFQRLAASSGLREQVHFMGGRDDVPEILAAGDLLIHPAYSENTGTVLIEAIAAGLPVLATDVCGYAPHITKADAGFVLCSPFRQEVLNLKLLNMLTSDECDRWHVNGIQYGKNPDLYRMPQVVVDHIEHRVNNRSPEQQAPQTHKAANAHIYIRPDLEQAFGSDTAFDRIMAITGEVVRKAPGRRTVRFSLGGKSFYLKTHTGVGWWEILKNLLYGRLPVIGAMNEWRGIHHLHRLEIQTMTAAGYGVSAGNNPSRCRSFILTEELADTISLEEFCDAWQHHPPGRPEEIRFKRWLITRIAQIARSLHNSGANHRDFYLCHFLLKREYTDGYPDTDKCELFVIDLHRMQIRKRTPVRWAIKDLAGLYFSSMETGLTRRDLFRFIKTYHAIPLREVLAREQRFWGRVRRRGENLYASEKRRRIRNEKSLQRSIPGRY